MLQVTYRIENFLDALVAVGNEILVLGEKHELSHVFVGGPGASRRVGLRLSSAPGPGQGCSKRYSPVVGYALAARFFGTRVKTQPRPSRPSAAPGIPAPITGPGTMAKVARLPP